MSKTGRVNPAVLALCGAAGIFIFMFIAGLAKGPAGQWQYVFMVPQDGSAYRVEARLYRPDPDGKESLWLEVDLKYAGTGKRDANTSELDQTWLHAERVVVCPDEGKETRASPGGPWNETWGLWYGKFYQVFEAEPGGMTAKGDTGYLYDYPVVDRPYNRWIERITISTVDMGIGKSRVVVTVIARPGRFESNKTCGGFAELDSVVPKEVTDE